MIHFSTKYADGAFRRTRRFGVALPSIISEDERGRKRARQRIALNPRTKSGQLRNDDAGVEIRGKPNRENGQEGWGEGKTSAHVSPPLHCVTKRATRPAKSMSTLMRVPRCVKIPRRRNNIGRARCSAIHPPLRRGRIVVGALFFFIYFRYFPLFPTGYSCCGVHFSARYMRSRLKRECDQFRGGFKRNKVLPLR